MVRTVFDCPLALRDRIDKTASEIGIRRLSESDSEQSDREALLERLDMSQHPSAAFILWDSTNSYNDPSYMLGRAILTRGRRGSTSESRAESPAPRMGVYTRMNNHLHALCQRWSL